MKTAVIQGEGVEKRYGGGVVVILGMEETVGERV